MNPEINKLRTLADNMGAKLLPVMNTQNLTKKDVYVVVDTPKKAKKLKKLLDMFGEPHAGGSIGHSNYDGVMLFGEKWCAIDIYSESAVKIKVSIKELRNILAKEHLEKGDYVICSSFYDSSIVKIKSISGDRINVDKELFFSTKNLYTEGLEHISRFKRYATPEEIALLEPKPKELVVGKWYLFIGHKVADKPLMLITENNGSCVIFCGFNFLGKWVDNDLYTLEDLKRYGYTEATPQEVEEALIKEAKRRYKTTNKIESFDLGEFELLGFGLKYNQERNVLYASGGGNHIIFNNGKWAEVIDKFAELKEAHKNRAVIQLKVNGTWEDMPSVIFWDALIDEYRIKPEEKPKVGDVVKLNSTQVALVSNQQEAYRWRFCTKLTQQEAIDLLFRKEAPNA